MNSNDTQYAEWFARQEEEYKVVSTSICNLLVNKKTWELARQKLEQEIMAESSFNEFTK